MSDEQTVKHEPEVVTDQLLDVSLRDARDTALNATEAVRVTTAAITANVMLEAIDTVGPFIPFMDTSDGSPAKKAVKTFLEFATQNPLRG